MKILYITYENVYKTGILQAMVIKPLKLLSEKYDVEFIVTSTVKKDEMNDKIYKKNKEEFLRYQNNKIKIKEFYKKLKKNQSIFIFIKDIFPMIIYAIKESKKSDIIHTRSYGAGLIGLIASFFSKKPFIFDMRGTLPEETVEVGKISKKSFKYKLLKYIEKLLIKKSSYVITVSENMKKYVMSQFGKKQVINFQNPTDFNMFEAKKEVKKERINFIYSGSLQVWHLPELTIQYYKRIQEKFKNKVYFYFCVNDIEKAEGLFEKYNLPKNSYEINSVPFSKMPEFYKKADIGFSFIRESFSKSVCFPVKFSEYIASEIFVLTNENIGDLPEIIKKFNTGLCFQDVYDIDRNIEQISKKVQDMLNGNVKSYNRENLDFLDWNKNGIDNLYLLYKKIKNGEPCTY